MTLVVPPGTVFGRLTVVEEAPRRNGKRAMLCQCKCGKQKIATLQILRSGRAKSCGCHWREVQAEDIARLKPGEVPLYGKRARGRVAVVDLENYSLVMQHRWHVREHDPVAPGRRANGPYAAYEAYRGGRGGTRVTVYMHQLIAGTERVDHIDGDGLNNRRANLRPASQQQNMANSRKNPGKASIYKGVTWDRSRSQWCAKITVNRQTLNLGRFSNEEDAALTYDIAARRAFGEYALTNFQDEPTQAVLADLQARREADHAAVGAKGRRKISASKQEWWRERPLVTHTCRVCGAEFRSNAVRVFYCGKRCKDRSKRQKAQMQAEGRLF
jgi:hypothetical protein